MVQKEFFGLTSVHNSSQDWWGRRQEKIRNLKCSIMLQLASKNKENKRNWRYFPFMSLLYHFHMCILFTESFLQVYYSYVWHSHTMVSGIFVRQICWCQWMVAILTSDYRSQLLFGIRAQILAIHTNNFHTARWLHLFADEKIKTFSLKCQMLRLGHVSDEIPFTMKASYWASQVPALRYL